MRSDQVVQGFTQLGIGKLSKTHKRLHNLPGSLSHFLPVVLVKNFSLYLARTSLISVYSCFLSSPCHAWLWRAWLPPPSPLPVSHLALCEVPLKPSLYQVGQVPLIQPPLMEQHSSLHPPDGLCWACSSLLMSLLNWGHKSVCSALDGLSSVR